VPPFCLVGGYKHLKEACYLTHRSRRGRLRRFHHLWVSDGGTIFLSSGGYCIPYNPMHLNPDDYIKSQITVSVTLPLTDLPRWYKGKVPTDPRLSTGQTDHLPSPFSDPGANWSLHQDPVNEHHQYVQLYQPIKSAVRKANRATQKLTKILLQNSQHNTNK
jgi:hypothetical protein